MSKNIILNEENFSKFSKKLKSKMAESGFLVKYSKAREIFAGALGFKSTHHLVSQCFPEIKNIVIPYSNAKESFIKLYDGIEGQIYVVLNNDGSKLLEKEINENLECFFTYNSFFYVLVNTEKEVFIVEQNTNMFCFDKFKKFENILGKMKDVLSLEEIIFLFSSNLISFKIFDYSIFNEDKLEKIIINNILIFKSTAINDNYADEYFGLIPSKLITKKIFAHMIKIFSDMLDTSKFYFLHKIVQEVKFSKEIWYELIKEHPSVWYLVPKEIITKHFFLHALDYKNVSLFNAPDEIINNAYYCDKVVRFNGSSILYVPDNILNEIMCFNAVSNEPASILTMKDYFLTKELFSFAVKSEPWILQRICNNDEFFSKFKPFIDTDIVNFILKAYCYGDIIHKKLHHLIYDENKYILDIKLFSKEYINLKNIKAGQNSHCEKKEIVSLEDCHKKLVSEITKEKKYENLVTEIFETEKFIHEKINIIEKIIMLSDYRKLKFEEYISYLK